MLAILAILAILAVRVAAQAGARVDACQAARGTRVETLDAVRQCAQSRLAYNTCLSSVRQVAPKPK